MADELVFERHPVDCGANCISGLFGSTYRIDSRPAYPHRGVDYNVGIGTPVHAPAGGTVVPFANDGGFGIGVCIDHPGTPWYSLYAHLSSKQVQPGDNVRAGQVIGYSGNTGLVTGPHLHWQLCRTQAFPPDFWQSEDPFKFLRDDTLEAGFMADVLGRLGLTPTAKRVAMLRAWARRERMPLLTTWNPLATTSAHAPLRMNTDWDIGHGPGRWNSVPVRVYASRADGVRATADSIAAHYYPNIRESLRRETGLDAAAPDIRTWIGEDRDYGPELIAEWKRIGASAPAPAPPEDDDEEEDEMAALEAVRELNRAMVMREQIRAVASNLDLPTVEKAHSALVAAGVIKEA